MFSIEKIWYLAGVSKSYLAFLLQKDDHFFIFCAINLVIFSNHLPLGQISSPDYKQIITLIAYYFMLIHTITVHSKSLRKLFDIF
jgi:hypothetical protein